VADGGRVPARGRGPAPPGPGAGRRVRPLSEHPPTTPQTLEDTISAIDHHSPVAGFFDPVGRRYGATGTPVPCAAPSGPDTARGPFAGTGAETGALAG
jgi:hypothetical protein